MSQSLVQIHCFHLDLGKFKAVCGEKAGWFMFKSRNAGIDPSQHPRAVRIGHRNFAHFLWNNLPALIPRNPRWRHWSPLAKRPSIIPRAVRGSFAASAALRSCCRSWRSP